MRATRSGDWNEAQPSHVLPQMQRPFDHVAYTHVDGHSAASLGAKNPDGGDCIRTNRGMCRVTTH